MSVIAKKKGKSINYKKILNHLLLILMSFVMVYPILWWFFGRQVLFSIKASAFASVTCRI